MKMKTVPQWVACTAHLDLAQAFVLTALYMTMRLDDPELAETWRDLSADEWREIHGRSCPLPPTPILLSRAYDALKDHPRYGYVTRWICGLEERAASLKYALAAELGDWASLDSLLCGELDRRGA